MKGSLTDMNSTALSIFSFLLIIVILWFTYSIANIIVTIIRCKKIDHSLQFCFNTKGKLVYTILAIVYIIGFLGGIAATIFGFLYNQEKFFLNGLNVAAFVSVVFAFALSSIVMIGRKNMMVGRMMIDYRKLKKVNFSLTNKVTFVYAQKDYSFFTYFVDIKSLRKKISG